MWVLSLLLGIVVVLLITAATGYFVAQEFAYMAVDRSRLGARASRGDAAAGRALAVTRRTSFMLSGAQLGITVTGLLVGYVAEPLIGESLGTALGGVGVPTGVGIAVGTVLALVFSTFVQMLFGELFPKNLAIARPEPIAVGLATSTTWYLRLFGWLIWAFDGASTCCCAPCGSNRSMTSSTPRRHATSSTSWRTRARAATCPRSCRCCWTGSSTSPSEMRSTR
jgi:CBS domain containing-hemolysin-like protein